MILENVFENIDYGLDLGFRDNVSLFNANIEMFLSSRLFDIRLRPSHSSLFLVAVLVTYLDE